MKKCTKCSAVKKLEEYHNFKIGPMGKAFECKECANASARERYQKNREENLKKKKIYTEENKEVIFLKMKIYQKSEQGISTRKKNWAKRMSDPLKYLENSLRHRITATLKSKGFKKDNERYTFLGVDYPTLKKHIERQFKKGMTWDNHGRGEGKWQLDHIIPLASAKNEQDLYLLCHYTNLQPLWWIENIKKRCKIPNVQMRIAI